MPSYTQYLRQMAVLDADDSDIESWITVKGNHIPIKKGQSKEDAVKEFVKNKFENKEWHLENTKTGEKHYANKNTGNFEKENKGGSGKPTAVHTAEPKKWNSAEINKRDFNFRRQMLGRLKQDNDYFLGNGGRAEKHLWAGNVKEQIQTMRDVYKALPDKERPEWLTEKQINDYEKKMGGGEKKEPKNKQVFYKNTSGKQIGSPKGRTFIENEIMTEKEMAKYGFDPSDKRFERKELGKNEHHFFFGARFENIKEPSEAKTIAEFETVRKNALANPNLYGGKYTQKSKYDAYKEYKNDTSSKENMQKANEFVNSELVSKKENGRKERPVHISEALNDVMTETKEKMERGHGKPEHYAHKWESALEPHNLTDKELEDKLSLYRSVRRNRPDDNELIDKINDIKHVLELRQKKD